MTQQTIEKFQEDFRKLVRETLAMPENSVRKANTNAPTGPDPFATVLFTNLQQTGQDYRKYDDIAESTDVQETGQGMRTVLASVQFFRAGAYHKLSRLKTLLTIESFTIKLQEIGLGLVRSNEVRDISSPVDGKWEERAQMDIEFSLIAREDLTVPTYGKFPIGYSTEESSTNFEVNEP
jgi:hypothetical protein